MEESDLLFYDGQCGLCQGSVRFVLARDRKARFRFAPLGGVTFAQRMPGAGPQPDSMAILTGDRLLLRSDAVLHILRRLGGAWAVLATVAAALPRPWRDGLYDLIARNRHRWFRKGPEACSIPPRGWFDRFLP